MIKLLIISYNALPLDVVSSYRAKAYCDHLSSYGIFPTLLTHHWELNDGGYLTHDKNAGPVVEHYSTYSVIRLPYPGNVKSKSRVHTIISHLQGNIDVELQASYKIFDNFLKRHLKEEKYQLILSIFNPHFHLKLAYDSWKEFKIPYILDFRDLWDNALVTPGYKPTLKKKLLDSIIRYWWKKWIDKSLFFSTTGVKWKLYLEKLTDKEGLVVRNGFETRSSTSVDQPIRPNKFKVIHFGRIYGDQDISLFAQGFKLFAQDYSPKQVGVEIIGLKKIAGKDYQPVLERALDSYVTFIPNMSKEDLMHYCGTDASLFFFPNFAEDNGQFSVKLYDYMALRKNIVVSPSGGEVGEVVLRAKAGVVLDSPEEIKEYLQVAYDSFKSTGTIPLYYNDDLIDQYSRQNQVRILAERIHTELQVQP